jgi:hypothetical protein
MDHDIDLKYIVAPRKTDVHRSAWSGNTNQRVRCVSMLARGGQQKKHHKSFLDNFKVLDLPEMFCCSRRCANLLSGRNIEREKFQNVMHRFNTWVSTLLGSSVRAGTPVSLLRDTSANRLVEAGDGAVASVRFDRLLQAGVFKVRRVLDGRTHEVTASGFRLPGDESSGLQQRDSKKPRVSKPAFNTPSSLERQLETAQVAVGGLSLSWH